MAASDNQELSLTKQDKIASGLRQPIVVFIVAANPRTVKKINIALAKSLESLSPKLRNRFHLTDAMDAEKATAELDNYKARLVLIITTLSNTQALAHHIRETLNNNQIAIIAIAPEAQAALLTNAGVDAVVQQPRQLPDVFTMVFKNKILPGIQALSNQDQASLTALQEWVTAASAALQDGLPADLIQSADDFLALLPAETSSSHAAVIAQLEKTGLKAEHEQLKANIKDLHSNSTTTSSSSTSNGLSGAFEGWSSTSGRSTDPQVTMTTTAAQATTAAHQPPPAATTTTADIFAHQDGTIKHDSATTDSGSLSPRSQ